MFLQFTIWYMHVRNNNKKKILFRRAVDSKLVIQLYCI